MPFPNFKQKMNRQNFVRHAMIAAGGVIVSPFSFGRANSMRMEATKEPLPPDKVKEFVIAGHKDLEKVKSMLQEMPALLYATWDWGGGDFETALEGAGHVGNREIANYLIDAGSRTNLFVLTMLGKKDIVTAFLDSFPEYIHARGPHGFTLLHHANMGGEYASDLADYLKRKGLIQTKADL